MGILSISLPTERCKNNRWLGLLNLPLFGIKSRRIVAIPYESQIFQQLPCRALSGLIFSPPPLKPFALTLSVRDYPMPQNIYKPKHCVPNRKRPLSPRIISVRLPTDNIPVRTYVSEKSLWLKGFSQFLQMYLDG